MKTQRLWLLLLALNMLATSAAWAADVDIFGVVKQQNFIQENEKLVRLAEDDFEAPFEFELFVEQSDGGNVTSAIVGTPGGTNVVLEPEAFSSGRYFSFSAEHLPELNQQHANGNYSFNINSGAINVTLTLTGDNYPNVPRLINYNAAQVINAAANFTLTWDAFTGGTANDYIEVYIEDDSTGQELFHSGPPGAGLNGSSTSVQIPAGTLTAGKRYNLEIMFARIVDLDTTSGTTGVAGYSKRTDVQIATTGTDNQIPSLKNFRPYFGEQGVPVNSVIRFEFSEPMQQIVSLNWTGSGLNPANFTYTWNQFSTVLSAVYNGSLPTNTEIGWSLNSGGTMKDIANNSLPMVSGNFTTSSSSDTATPDVSELFLLKTQTYFQTGTTATALERYRFEAFGDLNVMNGILNGTITAPPPSDAIAYPENDSYGTTFDFEAAYASKADLDRFFPSGNYLINLMTAHDGPKNILLNFPADNYPNTPTLTDAAPLLAVDPAQALTVNWNSFTGADSSSSFYVQLYITSTSGDDVYESPGVGEQGALTGLSTSVTIPANTFSPGRTYECELLFARIVATDDSTYSGASFGAAFTKITKFELKTTGSPIRPTLTLVPGGGSAQINITGDKHVSYVLEATQDFLSWAEVNYPQSTYQNTTTTIFDNDSSFFIRRFYRVKEVSYNGFYQLPVSLQGTIRNSSNSNPIAGAIVTTSLDGSQAVTDSNGNFFLQTGTIRSGMNQNYTVNVNKAGFNNYSQSANWGDRPRNLNISLNPQ